jgi:hypothetical protein
VLWILGDIVGLPFLAAQLIQMIREDEAEAEVIDAELDAAEAAQLSASVQTEALAQPESAALAQPEPAQAATRPWWETDRRFADRFRPLDDPD